MEKYEQIEAYVNGLMEPAEKTVFEGQLAAEPSLKEQLVIYQQLHHHLQNSERLAQGEIALKNTIQEAIDEQKAMASIQAKVVPMRRRWLVGISAAAAVIVVILVVRMAFFAPHIDNQTLYAQYSSFENLSVTDRSNQTDSLLNIAVTFFNKGDFKQAIPAFDAYLAAKPDQAHFQLARGYALLQTGDYAAAEKDLLIVENGASAYTSQATWYRALSQLKQGNTDAAKKILSTIQKNEENYEQAQELLNKL